MKKEVNVIISGNRMPYKDDNIYFQYNEDYYTIVEYGDKKDFSIFTDNEWKDFQEILKTFSLRRSWLASDSDYCYIHTPKEYKDAVYFLTYCEIDFENIEVKEYLEGNEVYDLLKEIKDYEGSTINQIRDWISTNYDTIQKHYKYLLDN